MRKLNIADLFSASRLVVDLGLKEDVLDITEKVEAFKGANDIGYEIFFRLFSKATTKEAEKRIYDLFAGPFEMKTEEVACMELDALVRGLHEIANFPEFISFFKRAVTLMS